MKKPSVGHAGGQEYPALRSIQKFLQGIVEGKGQIASTVIKEILQNADDAEATHLTILLDERPAPNLQDFPELQGPALLVRNNAPFYICAACRGAKKICECKKPDDFHALCDVARGQKRTQATAAGRFGIGFNSVYFLTDTPITFSRREVHVFDLQNRLFGERVNGWQFDLDDFPASAASQAGPIKNILEWCLTRAAMAEPGGRSFGELAADPRGDYGQTLFRLPFRLEDSGSEGVYVDRFSEHTRLRVLREMVDESARSILFLKCVHTVSFWILRNREPEAFASIEAEPVPSEFKAFLGRVRESDPLEGTTGAPLECSFERKITRHLEPASGEDGRSVWSFHVRHRARFDDEILLEKRSRLRRNGERAIPWGAIAVPLDRESCRLDARQGSEKARLASKAEPAKWRVFLPLLEEGPSGCIFNASLFVGPNRQQTEFRLNEDDSGQRRTDWNQALVSRVLVPLLYDLSLDLPEIARTLLERHPQEYLGLFPTAPEGAEANEPSSLAAHFKRQFSSEVWQLRLPDIWEEPFEIWIGDDRTTVTVQLIPDMLLEYRERFRTLSTATRRFVREPVGLALAVRVAGMSGVRVDRDVSSDVALAVLRHAEVPRVNDFRRLLGYAIRGVASVDALEGSWSFSTAGDSRPLQFRKNVLYIRTNPENSHEAVRSLQALGLTFRDVEWVSADVGLAARKLPSGFQLENVVEADAATALELLRRLPVANEHDQVGHARDIRPVVALLIGQSWNRMPSDMHLGFLIRTANQKEERRKHGVILLQPATPTAADRDLWDVWFRRVFAEVDPEFGMEVRRLLDAHPGAIEGLHSHDCVVRDGTTRNALSILHLVVSQDAGLIDILTRAMNSHRDAARAQGASDALIDEADATWDGLDEEMRRTVLALPIHRTSGGEFVSLVQGMEESAAVAVRNYRLQSIDDIKDAPVDLDECRLLQSPNPRVRAFYRTRIGLEEHGRVAVLKEVLRQIGGATEDRNRRMLEYLVSNYEDTVRALDRSDDAANRKDSKFLGALFERSCAVPCLDGIWRPASDCVAAWRIAEDLRKREGKGADVTKLVEQLLWGANVARLDRGTQHSLTRLLPSPGALRELDGEALALGAIGSDSPELTLRDRIRVLDLCGQELPSMSVAPSMTALSHELPVLGGRAKIQEAEILESASSYSDAIQRRLAPKAVDLGCLAAELSLPAESVGRALAALGVRRLPQADLAERLERRLEEVWTELSSPERLECLKSIQENGLTARLREKGVRLETVLVDDTKPRWAVPSSVVSPRWATTRPPELPADRLPAADGVSETVLAVWNEWCGLRSLRDIFVSVLEESKRQLPRASTVSFPFYNWLEGLTVAAREEIGKELRTSSWVHSRCGDAMDLQPPQQVLLHRAEEVLQVSFWVPAVPLPDFIRRRGPREYGFQDAPPNTKDTVERLAACLAEAPSEASTEAVQSTYSLLEQILVANPALRGTWQSLAATVPVFRTFRTGGPRGVSRREGFLGDEKYKDDLSPTLVCLKSETRVPDETLQTFARLGLPERPTTDQTLLALSRIQADGGKGKSCYRTLVSTLEEVGERKDELVDAGLFNKVCVWTCAGTYEAVSLCYWDEELGQKGRISAGDARRLVETTDKTTIRLITWLQDRGCSLPRSLREAGELRLAREPEVLRATSEINSLLLPWKYWLDEMVREGSLLQEKLKELELSVSPVRFDLIPTQTIPILCQLEDGAVLEPEPEWVGPVAFGDTSGRVFAIVERCRPLSLKTPEEIAVLDGAIAREIALLLGAPAAREPLKERSEELLKNLERPSTVLRTLRQTNSEHFFHQYHDQVADLEFAGLFDEYGKTRAKSTRAKELVTKMEALLKERFVRERREQIRGYGYDEYSVFTELLQNAEDAYAQRERIGMAMPATCFMSFRYRLGEDGTLALDVEHQGRPFNYWHGAPEQRGLSKDVEGVLRSAGSFKPHFASQEQTQTGSPTIGRFGLGFKSVYLLTDRPEIHSGPWHFAISSGCLPDELPPPTDLEDDTTRIRLPLNGNALVLREPRRLVNLLPFLRMINRLSFTAPDDAVTNVSVAVGEQWEREAVVSEKVRITAPGVLPEAGLWFLRCRSKEHAGQLAMLLSRDGCPTRWEERFDSDLYVFLPLRAKHGLGVAVSHLFEPQSGRTHLRDRDGDAGRISEVAGLLKPMTQALRAMSAEGPDVGVVLSRFWTSWQWERGDVDTVALRQALARELVSLARDEPIVPTRDDAVPARFSDGPLFEVVDLPETFKEALIAGGVSVAIGSMPRTAFRRSNVVREEFVRAYRHACNFVKALPAETLVRIGIEQIAGAFKAEPWFSERPELLTALAETLSPEQRLRHAQWVEQCSVRGDDGTAAGVARLPKELFRRDFDGVDLISSGLLMKLSDVYSAEAIELLVCAGLRQQPADADVRDWVWHAGFSKDEAITVLRYLAGDERFGHVELKTLADLFRTEWFPASGGRISTRDARERNLIPADLLENERFRSWLGLESQEPVFKVAPLPPRPDPAVALQKLFDWWESGRVRHVARYEALVYPEGHRPVLAATFDGSDHEERRAWMKMLLLGMTHTMGRAQSNQHRDFLRRCEREGWLDVFAERDRDAQRWMDVLEGFLEDPTGRQDYYHWMKQFIVIFQLSRWLEEYAESFLSVNRRKTAFALDEITAPRTSAANSGGGPDAPDISRGLGMGACFVLRELTRFGYLRQPLAYRYCFVPRGNVRSLCEWLGCRPMEDGYHAENAQTIYQFVVSHLGEENATFKGSFDLPLIALADDRDLQRSLLGATLKSNDAGLPLGARGLLNNIYFRR